MTSLALMNDLASLFAKYGVLAVTKANIEAYDNLVRPPTPTPRHIRFMWKEALTAAMTKALETQAARPLTGSFAAIAERMMGEMDATFIDGPPSDGIGFGHWGEAVVPFDVTPPEGVFTVSMKNEWGPEFGKGVDELAAMMAEVPTFGECVKAAYDGWPEDRVPQPVVVEGK